MAVLQFVLRLQIQRGLPVIGATLIWLGAALWLYDSGQTGWAIFMVLWGVLVISSIDNFVRPYLISRGSSLSFLLIFLGVSGGIVAYGFIGIFNHQFFTKNINVVFGSSRNTNSVGI